MRTNSFMPKLTDFNNYFGTASSIKKKYFLSF